MSITDWKWKRDKATVIWFPVLELQLKSLCLDWTIKIKGHCTLTETSGQVHKFIKKCLLCSIFKHNKASVQVDFFFLMEPVESPAASHLKKNAVFFFLHLISLKTFSEICSLLNTFWYIKTPPPFGQQTPSWCRWLFHLEWVSIYLFALLLNLNNSENRNSGASSS